MVFCLSHFLPLLLVPFPTAAPLFVIVYLVTLFITRKPCMYCTVLLSGLLISTCYVYSPPSAADTVILPSRSGSAPSKSAQASLPLVEALSDAVISPSTTSVEPSQTEERVDLSLPDTSRCWCDFNSANFLSPVLVGYRQSSALLASIASPPQSSNTPVSSSTPLSPSEKTLPTTPTSLSPLSLLRTTFVHLRTLLVRLRLCAAPSPPTPPTSTPTPPTSPKSVKVRIRDELTRRWDSSTKRFDLRINGHGLILDFGWGRGEKTVQMDLERTRRARVGKVEGNEVEPWDEANKEGKDEL